MRRLEIIDTNRPDPKFYFGPADKGFLDWDTLLWRFAAERSYWVATADESARPHSMPVWGIWQEGAFLFSTYPESKKARNLKANPQANVHLANTEAVMILECDVSEVRDAAALQNFVDDYNPKYKWDFKREDVAGGVFALTPHTAFAWAAGEGSGFQDTATRWRFRVVE